MADEDKQADRKDGTGDLGISGAAAAELAEELGGELGDMPLEVLIKHLPAVLTVREVKALLHEAEGAARDYLLLRLLYYTGVRVGEAAALTFADVNDDRTAFVRSGKGDRDRYVCVDPRTMELVADWRGSKGPGEHVFGVGERELEGIVTTYGRRSGLVQKYEGMLRGFSAHSLRHGFATHRYDAGMDLFVIKKLLGHRHLSTTLIYVETSMRQALEQYRVTDPLSRAEGDSEGRPRHREGS